MSREPAVGTAESNGTEDRPLVAVTMGDPAGIGAEVIVKGFEAACDHADLVVVGDAGVLREAVAVCGSDLTVDPVDDPAAARGEEADGEREAGRRSEAGAESQPGAESEPGRIPVLDLDNVDELVYGDLREAYGRASLEYVERAIELATSGAVDGITTAPINKQATRMAGSEHAGHTGLLAARTGVEEYSMLLVEGDLRVSHVSTHVSLREAVERVTTERVFSTVRVTAAALADLGIEDPTVGVAGLNPHAGDGGLLGDEDADEIRPAVERAQEAGIDARGPVSPDTVFGKAAGGAYDAVVAMYHDQGHIPVKMLGFRGGGEVSGVNVTVGLPIVRTSVDHGTAFDIAGEGVASARSLVDAVEVAAKLARNRRREGEGA